MKSNKPSNKQSQKHQQAKADLLRELEFLRAQLLDPAGAELNSDEIPLLVDKVEQAIAADNAQYPDESQPERHDNLNAADIAALQAAYQREAEELETGEAKLVAQAIARLTEDQQIIDEVLDEVWQSTPGVLPGQQSLFDSAAAKADEHPAEMPRTRPAARGENPFLPEHIRVRLQERRQALANIAEAPSLFPAKGTAAAPSPRSNSLGTVDSETLVNTLVREFLPRIEAELRARLKQQLADLSNNKGTGKNNAGDPNKGKPR